MNKTRYRLNLKRYYNDRNEQIASSSFLQKELYWDCTCGERGCDDWNCDDWHHDLDYESSGKLCHKGRITTDKYAAIPFHTTNRSDFVNEYFDNTNEALEREEEWIMDQKKIDDNKINRSIRKLELKIEELKELL